MSRTKKVSPWIVLLHVVLTVLTGGFWLIVLIIWWLLNNK